MTGLTAPIPETQQRPDSLGKKNADHLTPLIRNCWYVAGTVSEVTRELMDRRILGLSIVFFRTEDGRPVALDNRCPHRSFPLSQGKLEGDTLVCGYHGIAFDACGTCVRIPTIPRVPPNFGLREFPLVERGPLLWIWMGDKAAADPALIPHYFPAPGQEGWTMVSGYSHVKSDYVQMHENLQDLSHFGYLHADSLGAPDFASAPMDLRTNGSAVWTLRTHLNADPPPLWKNAFKLRPEHRLSRVIESNYEAPSHIGALQTMTISPTEHGERSEYKIMVLHFLTPETQESFHYHWFHLRDFGHDSQDISEQLRAGYTRAFLEDKVALEAISALRKQDEREDFFEHSFAGDRPGLAVRRSLQRAADAEA